MQLHASRHARLSASSPGLQHRGAWTGAPRPVLSARRHRCTSANSSSNGSSPSAPSPAETARTIMHLCNEGTLSTITASGAPLGTPIAYTLDATSGQPVMHVAAGSLESQNLERQPSCSLLVQPNAYPARRVAAVAMQGSARPVEGEGSEPGMSSYALELDSCLYFGGLDASSSGVSISSSDYTAAQPDILRTAAVELINTWNSERADDMYRIVSHHLGLPLSAMEYAELLWLDRLGMYIRSEVEGREPQIVRVPFYRPVLDERDARSVITMAAQLAWEKGLTAVPAVAGVPRVSGW